MDDPDKSGTAPNPTPDGGDDVSVARFLALAVASQEAQGASVRVGDPSPRRVEAHHYCRLAWDRSTSQRAATGYASQVCRVYPAFVLEYERRRRRASLLPSVLRMSADDRVCMAHTLVQRWAAKSSAERGELVATFRQRLAEEVRADRERALSLLAKLDLALARKVGEALGLLALDRGPREPA